MAAHAAGLVHRDFKPDNAIIGRDARSDRALGRVRVLDFGLARGTGALPDLAGPTVLPAPATMRWPPP